MTTTNKSQASTVSDVRCMGCHKVVTVEGTEQACPLCSFDAFGFGWSMPAANGTPRTPVDFVLNAPVALITREGVQQIASYQRQVRESEQKAVRYMDAARKAQDALQAELGVEAEPLDQTAERAVQALRAMAKRASDSNSLEGFSQKRVEHLENAIEDFFRALDVEFEDGTCIAYEDGRDSGCNPIFGALSDLRSSLGHPCEEKEPWTTMVLREPCCENEKRNMNGGCVSCGAPCL